MGESKHKGEQLCFSAATRHKERKPPMKQTICRVEIAQKLADTGFSARFFVICFMALIVFGGKQ